METYRFKVEDLQKLTVEVSGENISSPPNVYLYGFLKYYLEYLKKEIQENLGNTDKEKVRDLEMVGLLLWNYFFSLYGDNSSSKIIESLRECAKAPQPAHFEIQFNETTEIDRYKLLPWELLFWPNRESFMEGKGNFLFHNEKIRLIRTGSILPTNIDFKINEEAEKVKILFCVSGLPADTSKEDESPAGEYRPLQYEGSLKTVINSCRNLNSELLIKINGLPEARYINGVRNEDKNSTYFSLTQLKACIHEFKPHVIHLITHGECNATGDLHMVFNDGSQGLRLKYFDTSDTEGFESIFKHEDYKDFLPKLVFLQVCQSGQSYLPIILSRYGVPAVIAMFYDVTQDLANDFAAEFYKKLLGEKLQKIGDAFHESRDICSTAMRSGILGFGLPIIYYNIHKEDQSLITEKLYSKSTAQKWADQFNDAKKSASQQRGGVNPGGAVNSSEERLRKRAKRLMEEQIEDLDTDPKDACEILQEAIDIFFSDYEKGQNTKLKEVLEAVKKEYQKHTESSSGKSAGTTELTTEKTTEAPKTGKPAQLAGFDLNKT